MSNVVNINQYKERCQHCVCLVSDDNDTWICDELEKPVEEIENCPEGLEL